MMSYRDLFSVITLLSLLAFAALTVAAESPTAPMSASPYYYVAPTGNDSNPGTESQPWATIGKANSTLQPGDTVYVRQGTYTNQRIQPAISGTSGNYISYLAYPGEAPILDLSGNPAIYIQNRDYIKVDGFIIEANGQSSWVNAEYANHNIISNNVFRNAAPTTHGVTLRESSWNQFINNTFDTHGVDPDSLGGSGLDAMKLHEGSDYNLIEGNHFHNGMHSLLNVAGGHHNIIRDNHFQNDWYKDCDTGKGTYRNLWEGNTFADSFDIIGQDRRHYGSGIQFASANSIVRYNRFYNNESGNIRMTIYADSPDNHNNRIYNNVMYHGGDAGVPVLFNYAGNMSGNIFKNNIIYKGYHEDGPFQVWFSGGPPDLADIQFLHNSIIYQSPGANTIGHAWASSHPLSWWQTNYPNNFADNIEVAPRFVNEASFDFRLQSDSPLVDAGGPLTQAVGSGSGTTLTVDDASYFCDGWGLVDADWIKIGAADPVQIGSIDYDTDTVTLAQPRSWNNGDPAYLYRDSMGIVVLFGNAPDIGAYEYTSGAQPTATPTPSPVPTATPMPTPTPTAVQISLRINSAGQNYTDASGDLWLADKPYSAGSWGYVGGDTVNWGDVDIGGTDDDDLYVSERRSMSGYQFDLPNGTYDIVLHFAQNNPTLTGPGLRVFDVAIEGRIVLDDFDPFAEAGFQQAISKVVPRVLVTNGQLDITFISKVESPEINAIEVLPAATYRVFIPIAQR